MTPLKKSSDYVYILKGYLLLNIINIIFDRGFQIHTFLRVTLVFLLLFVIVFLVDKYRIYSKKKDKFKN